MLAVFLLVAVVHKNVQRLVGYVENYYYRAVQAVVMYWYC